MRDHPPSSFLKKTLKYLYKDMLKYTDLKKGIIFFHENQPWVVLDYSFIRMQQQRPVVRVKIKNLKTGSLVSKTFQQSDEFEEVQLETRNIKFVYSHRGKNVFCEINDPSKRMELPLSIIQDKLKYLKPNSEVEAVLIEGEIVDIRLPVKVDLKVTDCPPSFKGNTATGGTKTAKLETGVLISVPMFIEIGDIIRVNTQEDTYAERVSKAGGL